MSTNSKSGEILLTIIIFVVIFLAFQLVKGCNAVVDYFSEDNIKIQTQTIVDFEKRLYDMEQGTKEIDKKVVEEFNQMAKGILPSIDTLREAQDTFESTSSNYKNLEIPDGLSEERETILKNAKDNFKDAYYSKSLAMHSIIQYLSDGDPKSLQNYKQALEVGNSILTRGVTSIVNLEKDLDVDLSKAMYKGK